MTEREGANEVTLGVRAWLWYYERTEANDRRVCTGKGRDGTLPATPWQRREAGRFAALCARAARKWGSPADMYEAEELHRRGVRAQDGELVRQLDLLVGWGLWPPDNAR